MRIVAAIQQTAYRLKSQEQTLFEPLAQCACNNGFRVPFGAYQINKYCRNSQAKGVQTNSHRRQEREARNSGAKLQSNEAHSGAWFIG